MPNEAFPHAIVVGFEPPPRAPGGIARYSRELWDALAELNQPDLVLHHTHVRERMRPIAARAWARGWRAPFGATIDGNVANRARGNLASGATGTLPTSFHATSVFAPPRGNRPQVVTIHDMVPFTRADTLTRHGAAWHRAMIRRAVTHADALIAPTRAVAASISEWFGNDVTSRIHVAGGAASLAPVSSAEAWEIRNACGIGERDYVVFVGTIEPRKGLDTLLGAVSKMSGLDLVIVGAQGWGGVNVWELASVVGCDPSRITVTGPLHDVAVAAIIQDARALVLPSQAEGFGLPLVEAMRLGTPVVHSDDPALCEVAADAGVMARILEFERTLPDEREHASQILRQAIERAIDERAARRAAGLQRAATFTWTETARRVRDVHSSLTVDAGKAS